MTDKFVFWAQALDNSSSDHIEIHGESLASDDAIRRQETVSLVSRVVKVGESIFKSDGVQLTADNHHFVMEVPSVQRDRAGRTAPIVCYGDYRVATDDTLGFSVAAGIEGFAKRIGRDLQSADFERIHFAFKSLKKKSLTKRSLRVAAIGMAIVVLMGLAFWLTTIG